jgi:hypothetical protein
MQSNGTNQFRILTQALAIIAIVSVPLLAQTSDAVTTAMELRIDSETVPPGGMLQLKVAITEPKPILKGGQKATFRATFLSPPRGIALFSPAGDASGTAVLSKGAAHFSLSSPISDMGNSIDYPILTVAMPVKTTAVPGSTAALVLDPSLSQWSDPKGKPYPVLLTNGILTVGGTISIADVVPGGGVVAAGQKIVITGVGFQPQSKVQINEGIIATKTYISPNEIDVILKSPLNMTSRRIRVTAPSTNETATYYSYQRTPESGKSTHALIASTVPLFSQKVWSIAYFKPVLDASRFTGLALQDPLTKPVAVRLQLLASNGTVLATRNLTLQPRTRMTRDLAELFPGVVPGNGTTVKVIVNAPIPMLGLLGDDVLGTVEPVTPSATP